MSDRSLLRGPRYIVAKREVASLSREKTIVLALLIQLFVAGFSSFLVVGLTSLYDPGAVASSDVEMAVTGDATGELLAAVDREPGTEARVYDDVERARQAFQDGRVDAILVGQHASVPGGSGKRIEVIATVPDGNIRSTLIVVEVRRVLNTLERRERIDRVESLDAPPVPLPRDVPASPYFGFTYTVLIPLLLFLPPFISGSVAVDAITEEIERGTLELLRVAPVTLLEIVDGKALGMILLAPAQALLWVALLSTNGIAVANVAVLMVYVTAISVLVVTFGVVLGVTMKKRRSAQLSFSVLTLVVFGAAVLLPEHPAATVAKLAVDSPTIVTYSHVAGTVVVAAVGYALTREYVGDVDVETL